MSMDLNSLTSQAMALPPDQRCELAQLLWASVEGKLDEDEALLAEIQRRCNELDAGTVRTYSHEEVMSEVKKVLGE